MIRHECRPPGAPRRRRLAAGLIVVVALLGMLSGGVRRVLAESLTRDPPAYTELYFSDPAHLPKTLPSTASSFSFVIANHEGRTVDYRFAVTAESPRGVVPVAQGTVPIADGRRVVQTVTFTPDAPATPFVIDVRLLGRSERIHFTGVS